MATTRAILGVAALIVASAARGADLAVELEGVDPALRSNIEALLDLYDYVDRDVSSAQVRLLYAAAEEQIRTALQPYGYYHLKRSRISWTHGCR